MTESVQTALLLFGVGMVTVFTILAGVIGTGQLLIRIVNSYTPQATPKAVNISPINSVHSKKLAVITAVVSEITEGRGKVEKIDKI